MTSIQIILHCHNRSKQNRYFVAPLTIIKQFEQDNIKYELKNDTIFIMNKKFRIEKGGNNAY